MNQVDPVILADVVDQIDALVIRGIESKKQDILNKVNILKRAFIAEEWGTIESEIRIGITGVFEEISKDYSQDQMYQVFNILFKSLADLLRKKSQSLNVV